MPPRPVVPHARFRKPPAYRKVHMLWLQAAALLPGRTLHTALALWMAACDTRNPTVLFNPKTALRFGVSREAAQDAISRLLAFGLVALDQDRRRGRHVAVTLLSLEGVPMVLPDHFPATSPV